MLVQRFTSSVSAIALAAMWSLAASSSVQAQGNQAQSAPAAEAAAPDQSGEKLAIETVVVTARHQVENNQTVPIAITALSADDLQAKGITSPRDLIQSSPSLTGSGSFTSNSLNFQMRGNLPNASSFGAPDTTVQPYFNDVAPIYASTSQFFDLQSVEVLRGPQGTLFGRSAIGGAVLFNPVLPTSDFGGYVEGQVGNYSDREFKGAINIPIDDEWSVRVAGQDVRRNGYTHALNLANYDLDNKDYDAFRISVLFKPTNNFQNVAMVNYSNVDQHAGSFILLNAQPNRTASALATSTNASYEAFLLANPDLAAIPGMAEGLQGALAEQKILGVRQLYSNVPASELIYKERTFFISDTATATFPIATVRNIFAYQKLKQNGSYDPDGVAVPILDAATITGFPTEFLQDAHQFSDELQVLGDAIGGRVDWQVGGYWQLNQDDFPGGSFGNEAFTFLPGTYANQTLNGRDNVSKAIYAHAIWHIIDGLNFTIGARRTWDDLTNQAYLASAATSTRGVVNGPGVCGLNHTQLFNLNEAACQGPLSIIHDRGDDWILSLDYQLTDNALVYVTTRHGYQPAGINTNTTIPGFIKYGQATTTDIEAGVKTQGNFGDVAWQINADGYYEKLKNAHRGAGFIDPRTGRLVSIITNASSSTVKGFEAEAQLIPVDYLRLSGFFNYTDAKYDSFVSPNIALDPNDPNCLNPVTKPTCQVVITSYNDLSFNPFPYTPKTQFGLTAQIDLPTPSEHFGKLVFTGTYYHQGQYSLVTDLTDDPTAINGPENLLNLRLDWQNALGNPIDVSAFITNATNEVYITGGVSVQQQLGITYGSYGEPRMFGLALRYRFGQDTEK